MSEAAVEERPAPAGALLTSRLGSIVALVPLGVWTTWHLWENLWVWSSADDRANAWEAHVSRHESPATSALVSALVFAPLILHVLWGLRRIGMTQPNQYRFFGNLKYLLQRLSALGLLAFLAAHVYLARIKPAFSAAGYETFEDIAAHVRHHPPTLIVYVLGVLGTAYHLANGVYTSAFIYGLAASPRAGRRVQWASVIFFLALLGAGWGALAGLYDAGAQYAPPVD